MLRVSDYISMRQNGNSANYGVSFTTNGAWAK